MRLQSLFFSATLLFAAMFSVGLLSSCSEDEKENEEFANWKSKNTTYWTDLYNTTKQKIANGDTLGTHLKIILIRGKQQMKAQKDVCTRELHYRS